MVTTIKQLVKVEAGGRVAVQSAELHEGESAEVIVRVERPEGADERSQALRALRQSLNLSPAQTAKWEADVRAERAAWREGGDATR